MASSKITISSSHRIQRASCGLHDMIRAALTSSIARSSFASNGKARRPPNISLFVWFWTTRTTKSLTISSVRDCFGSYLFALESPNAPCMSRIIWFTLAPEAEVSRVWEPILSLEHLFVLLSFCQHVPVISNQAQAIYSLRLLYCPRR